MHHCKKFFSYRSIEKPLKKSIFYQQIDWNLCLSGDLIFLLGHSISQLMNLHMEGKVWRDKRYNNYFTKTLFFSQKSYAILLFWSFNLVLPKSESSNFLSSLSLLSVLSLALQNSLKSFCPLSCLHLSAAQWPLLLSMPAYLKWQVSALPRLHCSIFLLWRVVQISRLSSLFFFP